MGGQLTSDNVSSCLDIQAPFAAVARAIAELCSRRQQLRDEGYPWSKVKKDAILESSSDELEKDDEINPFENSRLLQDPAIQNQFKKKLTSLLDDEK